jgi:hypothetical protein
LLIFPPARVEALKVEEHNKYFRRRRASKNQTKFHKRHFPCCGCNVKASTLAGGKISKRNLSWNLSCSLQGSEPTKQSCLCTKNCEGLRWQRVSILACRSRRY